MREVCWARCSSSGGEWCDTTSTQGGAVRSCPVPSWGSCNCVLPRRADRRSPARTVPVGPGTGPVGGGGGGGVSKRNRDSYCSFQLLRFRNWVRYIDIACAHPRVPGAHHATDARYKRGDASGPMRRPAFKYNGLLQAEASLLDMVPRRGSARPRRMLTRARALHVMSKSWAALSVTASEHLDELRLGAANNSRLTN